MLCGLLTTGCPENIGGSSAKRMIYVEITKLLLLQEIKCQMQYTTGRLDEISLLLASYSSPHVQCWYVRTTISKLGRSVWVDFKRKSNLITFPVAVLLQAAGSNWEWG